MHIPYRQLGEERVPAHANAELRGIAMRSLFWRHCHLAPSPFELSDNRDCINQLP